MKPQQGYFHDNFIKLPGLVPVDARGAREVLLLDES